MPLRKITDLQIRRLNIIIAANIKRLRAKGDTDRADRLRTLHLALRLEIQSDRPNWIEAANLYGRIFDTKMTKHDIADQPGKRIGNITVCTVRSLIRANLKAIYGGNDATIHG